TTHCRVVSGVRSAGEADFLAVMNSAPARMPILVMDVTSRNTDCDRFDRLTGWLQKGLAPGSNRPAAVAALAAHKPNPYTTPHGWPAISRFNMASTASRMAPMSRRRLNHLAPLPAQARAASPSSNSPASVRPKARHGPKLATRPTGRVAPSCSHRSNWADPRKLPIAKTGNITMFSGTPMPALYR